MARGVLQMLRKTMMSSTTQSGRGLETNISRISSSQLVSATKGMRSWVSMNSSNTSVLITTVLGMAMVTPSYLLYSLCRFRKELMKARPLPFPPRAPSPILEKLRYSS